jgi:LytS/YehU family sensor histidine kinase
VSFSEELKNTLAYLAVEKALYMDKLQIEQDTDFKAFRLPPLTLQPLVENAVKHGMNRSSGVLHIFIRTRYMDSGIEISVEDNGPGFDPSDESSPHTALANIRQRLEIMCGGTMTILPRDSGGTVVKITIPPGNDVFD